MRQRWMWIGGALAVAVGLGALLATLLGWQPARAIAARFQPTAPPLHVGLLHSRTGPLAISEQSLLDVEIMAIQEINDAGGVAGRRLTYSAPDCQSDPAVYAAKARQLLEQEHAAVLVGGWSSDCRKAMLPVVAERKGLLFFPGNYEGIESAPRVVYAGGAANQSVLPAVRWAIDNLKARRFFVLGLEEVWSRTSGEIAKDAIRCAGGEVAGEHFSGESAVDAEATVEEIRRAKPDVVLNFLFGPANLRLYSALRGAGLTAAKLPVIAFGFSEDESRKFEPRDVEGHYAAWNYFQSVARPENEAFIRRFRARTSDSRVIGDAMIAAYNAIRFWAQAANEVDSAEVEAVLVNLDRQSMDAPDGIVTIDPESRAVWRPFHLGRHKADGQFQIVYSILKPIRPVTYVGTRSGDDWRAFSEGLRARWQGRWSDPGSPGPR